MRIYFGNLLLFKRRSKKLIPPEEALLFPSKPSSNSNKLKPKENSQETAVKVVSIVVSKAKSPANKKLRPLLPLSAY